MSNNPLRNFGEIASGILEGIPGRITKAIPEENFRMNS